MLNVNCKLFIRLVTIATLGAWLLVPLQPALAVSASDRASELRDCLSFQGNLALTACENYVNHGGTEIRAFMRLGKLYQERREFSKAERVYELALKFNQESSSLQTKLKKTKSNIDEQAWMAANSKAALNSSSANLKADRLTCVKMARVRPQKALDACNRYLAASPGDPKATKAQALASSKLSGQSGQVLAAGSTKTAKSENIELAALEISSSSRSSSGQTVMSSENAVPVPSTETSEPQVAAASPTPAATPAVDASTIEAIKADLAKIYSLVQEQKATPEQTSQPRAPSYQENGKRRALVIGVSQYPASLGALKNPENDAKDIAKTLNGLGFEVDLSVNGSLREMEEIIAGFSKKLGPDDTAMFYYAGHGVQIDGENYLIPAGVEIADVTDVKYKSVNLSYILEKIQSRGKGVNLVVLDACRDNPFGKSRGISQKGWATVNGPVGTLIAYATAPGQVASDGSGDNGVYTKHLIAQMTKPNVKVEDVFKGVRIAVDQETGGEQIPWENSSLIGDFYFATQG